MSFLVSLLPATIFVVIGYFLIYSSAKSEGGVKRLEQILGARLLLLGGPTGRCNVHRVCWIAIFITSVISPYAPSLAQNTQDETQTAQMEQMQARMQAMQEQMARIQATEDPQERQRLMREHMQSMEESMTMMGELMRGSVHQGRQAQQCAQNDTDCRLNQMQMQQGMMGQRMGMMQQMMQQMMEGMNERHMMRGPSNDGQ